MYICTHSILMSVHQSDTFKNDRDHVPVFLMWDYYCRYCYNCFFYVLFAFYCCNAWTI